MSEPGIRTAVAYYRTSSAANVGEDKDSESRQRAAVTAYAARGGLEIVGEYYDAAVSGADAIESRAGFCDMLAYMLGNGARTILVETSSRFARDLIIQETGYKVLKARGIEVVAADSPGRFLDDTPTAILIRQILGAVDQFDKAMTVHKLRGARDRASAKLGRRIEGAKWVRAQAIPQPHVQAAKRLRDKGVTLRDIGPRLAAQGIKSRANTPYGLTSVARMLKRAA